MENQINRFLVTEIDRAVNQKTGLLARSPAQKVIKFLLLNNRKHVANQITQDMLGRYVNFDMRQFPKSQSQEDLSRTEEIMWFLKAVFDSAPEVFQLPVLSRKVNSDGSSESEESYKQRLKQFYKNKGLVQDVHLMREYKILVSELFNFYGLQSPEYVLFGEERYEAKTSKVKKHNLQDDDQLLDSLVNFAFREQILSSGRATKVYPYQYKAKTFQQLGANDLEKKQRKYTKGILYYISLACIAIGIGEAFGPASISYGLLTSLALPGAVALPVAVIAASVGTVFFAAMCVNTMQMQPAVYQTLKAFILDGRFTKNAQGRELSLASKFANVASFVLSAFAALVIAGLSFYFSKLPFIFAAFVSAMTFIGFTSVLTLEVMALMNVSTIKKGVHSFLTLMIDPLKELWQLRFNLLKPKARQALYTLAVNTLANTAKIALGAMMINSGYRLFTSVLLELPVLHQFLGLNAIPVVSSVVSVALLTLGTFFTLNISRSVDAVRNFVLDAPKESKIESSSSYRQHPLRNLRVNIGNFLSGVFAGFSLLNGGPLGYAYSKLFANPLAGKFAYFSYLMQAFGGNGRAAINMPLAKPGLHLLDSADYSDSDICSLPSVPTGRPDVGRSCTWLLNRDPAGATLQESTRVSPSTQPLMSAFSVKCRQDKGRDGYSTEVEDAVGSLRSRLRTMVQ